VRVLVGCVLGLLSGIYALTRVRRVVRAGRRWPIVTCAILGMALNLLPFVVTCLILFAFSGVGK
jgi:hypothetical protein